MSQDDKTVRSVLIIDDDPGFADSLADLLQPRGYATFVVDTPERALAVLHEPPDGGTRIAVALVDVRLGGVESGVDLIPRLRAVHPELICALMTTGIDSQTAIAALRNRAYDYFDKSWDPNSLFVVLDRCFDRVALLRNHAAYEALRLAKEKAEARNRAKSQFLAMMSHELRTPLNAIIGFSDMMRREVLGAIGNAQYRVYIADIHESGAHLLQIIDDILDLSKAEAGKLEIHDEVFDLHDTIRSVHQLVSTRLADGGLSDSVDLPADLPLLRADERQTKQVLLNLMTNAIKFTPSGGHIEIAGRFDPEAGLLLTVRDTGIGISPADLSRVLEPFEQADSSFSRPHQGSGLGLPLVKAIVELHGGNLELRSAIGAGTQVSVSFPLHRAVFASSDPQSRSAA
jgi:signal transduction histidine kinase